TRYTELFYHRVHAQLAQALNSLSPNDLLRYYATAWRSYAPANPAPIIAGIDPLAPGQTTLHITGSGFLSTSGVLWNGYPLQTTSPSTTQLRAVARPNSVPHPGVAPTPIPTPSPGGGQPMPRVIATPGSPAPLQSVLFGAGPASLRLFQPIDLHCIVVEQFA